jgi:N,N-dimethylformamidase
MPDSYEPSLSWVMEGIEEEIFGGFGLAHDGSAGLELDAYDLKLGTPPNAKLVAASGGHDDNYLLMIVPHEHEGMYGSYDYRIRGDMTYFDAPNGGAVFSFSSIAFGQALPVNNFENDISRLLANVVNTFLKPGSTATVAKGGPYVVKEKVEAADLESASSTA